MAARLAILVDGDNISGCHARNILVAASAHGRPDLARVYADAQRTMIWHDTPEFNVIHAGTGKNASDLLLTIDAMELALLRGFEAIVIASSDGDFTHLGRRLREIGKTVIGLGEAKTPQTFRCACSSFVELGNQSSKIEPGTSGHDVTELDRRIRSLIAANSKNGEGMKITELSPKMHALHGTRISTYPEKTWHNYLRSRPELYEVGPKGQEATVRFKPGGFRKV